MRYSVYMIINNMCDSLIEALNYIKNNKDNNINQVLLKDCLHTITAIKGTLEADILSIRKFEIFDLIEESLKEIDFLLDLASKEEEVNIKKLYDNIVHFSQLCKDDLKLKFKVVFFAELGEKWDSLETVYWAFKKREDCDVSVVIEPIYRAVKDKNGDVKSDIILKDFLTPLGIEHIPFSKYNIEADKPDMVIISQPYEGVTIKKFWPENIAKHSRLVYIPYFTSIANDKFTRDINCKISVAYYAWKIIAQSQKIKELYHKETFLKGKNVIVTGLPKWDIANKLDEKIIDVNLEWKRKFKDKKVILLNTHYTSAKEIQIYEEFYEYFQNRTDVALLWRPHPMTDTMYKIYYPQLQEKWHELNKNIENSDNMVIDRNTSYIESLKISDAMISHMSSMITQYFITKKPIYILLPKERKEEISSDWIIDLSKYNELSSVKTGKWKEFIEKVVHGIDDSLELRLNIIKRDLMDARGDIGNKVCEVLVEELKKELNLI